jgi:hypothetical protein
MLKDDQMKEINWAKSEELAKQIDAGLGERGANVLHITSILFGAQRGGGRILVCTLGSRARISNEHDNCQNIGRGAAGRCKDFGGPTTQPRPDWATT